MTSRIQFFEVAGPIVLKLFAAAAAAAIFAPLLAAFAAPFVAQ